MEQPVPVSPTEQDAYLLKRARHLLCYQLVSIVALLWPASRPSLQISTHPYAIGIAVFLILSVISIYQTFNNTECPQCGRNFFFRWGALTNIPFSVYTHKCANCKYKLQRPPVDRL